MTRHVVRVCPVGLFPGEPALAATRAVPTVGYSLTPAGPPEEDDSGGCRATATGPEPATAGPAVVLTRRRSGL